MALDWVLGTGEDWGLNQAEELGKCGSGGPSEEQDLSKESWKERFLHVLKGSCCCISQTTTGHHLPPHPHPCSSSDLAFLQHKLEYNASPPAGDYGLALITV